MRCPPLRVLAFGLVFALSARVALASKSQQWIELRSPNFIVVTNSNESQAMRVAYQFETIRAVFREFFRINAAKDERVTILAAKDEDTLKTLLPDYWARKGSVHPAGIYLGSPEKNYIALRLDVSLNVDADEPFGPVYHEYVHYLTRRLMSQLPLWLVEGLAEFYGNTRISKKTAFVGAPSGSNLAILKNNRLLPLATLFAVNASSPHYHEDGKSSILYAQSWALTHYLVTRDWREKSNRFYQFVTLLGENVEPEKAAWRTIGDPAVIEKELNAYVRQYAFTASSIETPPEVDESKFEVQPLSEGESLAARADLMVHSRHYADAKPMLEEAIRLSPKLGAAYESMGFLYAQQNLMEQASMWYAKAVELDSQSYLTHYYYSLNLMKGAMDPGSASKAESSLRTALKLDPDFAPACDALAYLLASRNEKLEEAQRLALQAVSLEKGNVHYRLRVAQVLTHMGRPEDAVTVATRAAAMAKTPQEQTEARATLTNAEQLRDYQARLKEKEEALRRVPETRADQADTTGTAIQSIRSSAASSPIADGNSHAGAVMPPTLQHQAPPPDDNTGPVTRLHMLPQHDARPEVLPTRKVFEGKITEGSCTGLTSLELTVKSAASERQFYNDSYMKISYSSLGFTPKGILNPCLDLKGMSARITYHPAKDQPQRGEIVAITLVK